MLETSIKTFRFINYLLIAFIIVALLLLARYVLSVSLSINETSLTSSPSNASSRSVSKKISIMNYSTILEKNPFGPPLKFHPITALKNTEAPYSPLTDLVLMGTAVGAGNFGYAIFEDKSQSPVTQDLFFYGDKIYNYGTLIKIDKTSVTLEQDAITYTLTIPFENIKSEKEIPQAQSTSESKGSFAKKIGERQYVLDSSKVQQSLENPEKILTDARLLPNFIDGVQEGFKISEVIPDGLYHSLGLINGDVLLKINGLEISNPEIAIQALSALKGMNRLNLDIKRNDNNMSMNYQIR